jgi:ABC-type polysaccharide/polyol phosphate export permease
MTKDLGYYNNRLRTYYETVHVVAAKNLKVRYKNSMLGFLWTLINPLFMLSVFVFVLGNVIHGIDRYPLYVLSGLMFWNFFTTSCSQMINKIVESERILKSVNIPPVIFPLSSLVSNLVNFVLTFFVFLGIMLFLGYIPGWPILLILPAFLMFLFFTFGIALALATLNVYFRDVEMFWTSITPALMYATPIVYETPTNLEKFMVFNPFAHFMVLFRDILYYNQIPELNHILFPMGISIATFGLGLFVYNKLKREFIFNF